MRANGAKVRIEAGVTLFREGDPGDYAVYLEEGEVEITVLQDGRRVALARKGPGELFGEMAIVDGRRRSATVTTLSPCELIQITREQLLSRLEQADPVVRLWLCLLTDRLRATVEHIQGAPASAAAIAPANILADSSRAAELIRLEHELEVALAARQFELHFQPIIALADSRVAGFEALIRWRHPTRGLVPPAAFLPAAEASGFIRRIDAWAIGEACAAWRRFRATAARTDLNEDLFVGVNVSAPGLTEAGFLDRLDGELRASDLPRGALKLEITETMLIGADLSRLLEDCRDLGVGVALDDFGTGYSSLSYLHRFPIDTLKLDRSFIQDVGGDGSVPPILRAVLRLAQDLRLPVVAEGIERADQSRLLAELGADYAQGFYFARALPAAAAEALVRSRPPLSMARPGRPAMARGSLGRRVATTSVAEVVLATG